MRISDWSSDVCSSDLLARLAARVEPKHPWTRLLEGSVALERGDADAALVLLSQAADEAPDDAQIRYALGFAHLKKGHLAFAEQAFRGALEKMPRSEEHTSELQSLMRLSYAVFCLQKHNHTN